MGKKSLDELAKEVRQKEAAAKEAAYKAIPEQYQDFIMFLPQNECLLKWEPDEDKKYFPDGVFAWKGKTFINVKYPYMVVAGRVKWFCDDHKEAGAKYKISTNINEILEILKDGQKIPPGYPFVTKIVSELHGEADALASINLGGKSVDATCPLENAETSSLGRALAKMGYGLIGSGLASAEEIEESRRRKEEATEEKTAESEKKSAKSVETSEAAKPAEQAKKPAEKTGKPELVEIASVPRDVPTSQGTYVCYQLVDGRHLMLPPEAPKLPQGTKAVVSGFIQETKTGDLVLWAKKLENVA
jgi:hypothetical protein